MSETSKMKISNMIIVGKNRKEIKVEQRKREFEPSFTCGFQNGGFEPSQSLEYWDHRVDHSDSRSVYLSYIFVQQVGVQVCILEINQELHSARAPRSACLDRRKVASHKADEGRAQRSFGRTATAVGG